MRIKVAEPPVRQNIELFLNILKRVDARTAQNHLKAWVNRETGHFSQESYAPEKSSWKPVEVFCVYDPREGEICFLIEEAETQKESFRCDDLSPVAFVIMRDTLKILNEVSQRLKGPSDLQTKLAVITKLHIESEEESHLGKNILIEAWHPADRLQAESILWDQPAGTYLFRKDPYAELLEIQLQLQLGKKLKCFTLTYCQAERKFNDLTLIHCEGHWLIYNDDPSLEGKKFHELQHLLEQFRDDLLYPFYV